MKLRRQGILIAMIAVFALGAAQAASAAPILQFAQAGVGSPITATNNGAGSTTIAGVNVGVTITGIAAAVVTPTAAFFNLSATSTNAAVPGPGGQGAIQNYSGNFCITSLAGCAGINYLTGSFTDVALGAGTSLVLAAAQPPDTVSFNSGVIPISLLDLPRALGLSFAGVNPAVSIVNGSIGSFTSSVSGVFSAEPTQVVPEPTSLLLFGSGLVAVARRLRRKNA